MGFLLGSDFNFDFGVSFTADALADHSAVYNYGSTEPGFGEREGLSVFAKNEAGEIFHTYSAYARGIDMATAPTSFSTSCPRAATSRRATASSGCDVMTSTAPEAAC